MTRHLPKGARSTPPIAPFAMARRTNPVPSDRIEIRGRHLQERFGSPFDVPDSNQGLRPDGFPTAIHHRAKILGHPIHPRDLPEASQRHAIHPGDAGLSGIVAQGTRPGREGKGRSLAAAIQADGPWPGPLLDLSDREGQHRAKRNRDPSRRRSRWC